MLLGMLNERKICSVSQCSAVTLLTSFLVFFLTELFKLICGRLKLLVRRLSTQS